MKIALLGFGVVGGGVGKIILENADLIKKCVNDDVEIKYILDKRDFEGTVWQDKIVKDINIILNDPEISLVCEMMGGIHPAYDFSLASLEAGKSVVTSNKAVVAYKGAELLAKAKEKGVYYLFEASVGGGIPIIHAMTSSLAGCRIKTINGILNGTTNYILTEMSKGSEYSKALSDAQALGYAEADPTADVSGADSCRKICILSSVAKGTMYNYENVYTRGIDGITDSEKELAEEFGARIKLVATAILGDESDSLFVSPAAVSESCPLFGVSGVFNAALIDSESVGELLFYGQGAGRMPTASAVVSDITDALSKKAVSLDPFTEREKSDGGFDNTILDFIIMAKADKDFILSSFENVTDLKEKSGVTDFRVNGITLDGIKGILKDGLVSYLRIL